MEGCVRRGPAAVAATLATPTRDDARRRVLAAAHIANGHKQKLNVSTVQRYSDPEGNMRSQAFLAFLITNCLGHPNNSAHASHR